jgi:DNA-binding winged helix-turn-helix (wHTH) protein/TolB-like protein
MSSVFDALTPATDTQSGPCYHSATCSSCPSMEHIAHSAHIVRFGLFEADAFRGTLTRNGVRVKIQDQPFRVLVLLLERPGEVITREELREKLWPEGTYVDFDGSLGAILKKLRAAINDDSDNPRFIETLPRRGYRFIAPVLVDPPALIAENAKAAAHSNFSQVTSDKLPPASEKKTRSLWALALASFTILILASLVGWRYSLRNRPGPPATRKVIAVLPFSNEGAGPDFDYLRYAIANELVTDLAHARSVSVRPFASTSRFASQPGDPAAIGEQLRVTHVVAGGFLLDKKTLHINIELVDVARNQPVWRDDLTVPAQELIALHEKLVAYAAHGLLPAIHVLGAAPGEVPNPKNEQALDLFLHSLTISLDPQPNQSAIRNLEESVSLDSAYAPAWGELGWRYYIDFHYGNRGEAVLAKSLEAYKRQSELDPDTPPVWTNIRVEQGDLKGAYDQAAKFLRRRPDLSIAHFGMSYVLRYAGLLDEAGKECDAALALDPGFNGFRSCAVPLILQGDYAHAQTYISLDEGFGAIMRMRIALRTGNSAAVLAESNAAMQSGYGRTDDQLTFLRVCLKHAPQAEISKAAAKFEADPVASRDPELLYQNAEDLGFCGQADATLRQLARAIKGNHCSYPAMENDPQFDLVRQRPEFAELRVAAAQCQQKFLTHRERVDISLAAVQ